MAQESFCLHVRCIGMAEKCKLATGFVMSPDAVADVVGCFARLTQMVQANIAI